MSDIKKKYHGKSAKNICSELEKDLRVLSDCEVRYFVLNTRVNEDTDEGELCNAIVYTGASAPPEVTYTATNDKDYWEYYLDTDQDVVYRQLWDGGGKFEHHPPISVSYRSRFTQPRQFDHLDMKLFQKGVNNNRGTFPVRKSVGIMGGSNSYFGYRRKHCVTMPTVSQGPGVLAQYQYNRQFVDCLYLVFILRVLNAVGQFTSNSMRFFWKHLHLSSVFRHSPTWICGLHILTLNFYNSPHVDNDTLPYDKHVVLDELNAVIDCEDVMTIHHHHRLLTDGENQRLPRRVGGKCKLRLLPSSSQCSHGPGEDCSDKRPLRVVAIMRRLHSPEQRQRQR